VFVPGVNPPGDSKTGGLVMLLWTVPTTYPPTPEVAAVAWPAVVATRSAPKAGVEAVDTVAIPRLA
jgi:hypothetical protein